MEGRAEQYKANALERSKRFSGQDFINSLHAKHPFEVVEKWAEVDPTLNGY